MSDAGRPAPGEQARRRRKRSGDAQPQRLAPVRPERIAVLAPSYLAD